MNDDAEKQDESPGCKCGGGNCCGGSGKWVWIVLALAIAGVLIAKNAGKNAGPGAAANCCAVTFGRTGTGAAAQEPVSKGNGLPRFVDLGAGRCIPCKMMAPILVDLKSNYVGRLDVEFVDVSENPDEAKKYQINIIPTQIFYGVDGKELFRHEGFFSKEDILAKWREFGIELELGKSGV
jgi:thioredoxin 1